jgi:hypothetical protein
MTKAAILVGTIPTTREDEIGARIHRLFAFAFIGAPEKRRPAPLLLGWCCRPPFRRSLLTVRS